MKKKILFVYDSMMIGGTSTALLSLMKTIDYNKYDISLLLYTNTGKNIEEIPTYVHLLPQAYIKKPLLSSKKNKILRTLFNGQLFLAIKSFFKYRNTPKGNFRNILMHYGMQAQVSLSRIIDEQYDIAIGFMEGWSNQYVASSKIKALKKYIWIHPQYKSCYLIPEIDIKNFKNVDRIVLISEECMKQFIEFFPEFKKKIFIMPNIVSKKLIQEKSLLEKVYIKKKKINFCTVCRCDIYVKGLDRLLNIFCELKRLGLCKDVLWHLIGDGTDFEKLKNDIEKLDIKDIVILYGNKMNPLPYLKEMDIFLLASRYEGKPLAVTEAQNLGLPCLVTNYESAYSQVKDGHNGLIMNNNYEDIYLSIKKIIENPELLEVWRKNVNTTNYSNEEEINKFYDLLKLGEINEKEK